MTVTVDLKRKLNCRKPRDDPMFYLCFMSHLLILVLVLVLALLVLTTTR